MRILDIAYTCPWPPRGGNDLRVWHLCRLLGRRAEQSLLCRTMNRSDSGHYPAFHGEPIEVHSLYLPRPGPLLRMLKALRYLPGPYPLMTAGFDFRAFRRRLRYLVQHGRFDVIVMDGIYLGSCWPLIEAGTSLKVLNHFDLEARSMRRKAGLFSPGWERILYRLDAARMERLERRVMRTADLVWVTSEVDRDAILEDDSALPVEVAPNGVDCEAIRPIPPTGGAGVLFVGSLNQFANAEGVQFFARDVFPLLRRRLPDAVFRVVGRQPGPEIKALAAEPGVEVLGEVDDLAPWYAGCAAVVTPIRAGGGTRLKILEAMAYGRPLVSTTLGCEGIRAENGRDVLLADDPAGMADALYRLMTRPREAAQIAGAARRLVENNYGWASIADRMYAVYESKLAESRSKG
jgi:glycosyltransferase involved in cell wall biosynthesis